MAILKYQASIVVKEQQVAVVVHLEKRRDVRFSITRRGVNVRAPVGIPEKEMHQQMEKLERWVNDLVVQKPQTATLLFGEQKSYKTGDILQVGNRKYILEVEKMERETHSASLRQGTISLKLSLRSNEKQTEKAIKHLLSRVVAQDFQQEIQQRVLTLNKQFFNRHIRSVNLKYNHSNWGSCSSKSNVNLSTKLLFAPQEVQDYVIIHELAHLIEMNHSDKFWALVATAMPDYLEKEAWLKKHGKTCDF